MGNSPGLDLAVAGASPLNGVAASSIHLGGDDRLNDFYEEIGDPEPQFFMIMGMAAKEAATNRTLYTSGYCEPSEFNVQDVIGVGLLARGIFKYVLSQTLRKIDAEA